MSKYPHFSLNYVQPAGKLKDDNQCLIKMTYMSIGRKGLSKKNASFCFIKLESWMVNRASKQPTSKTSIIANLRNRPKGIFSSKSHLHVSNQHNQRIEAIASVNSFIISWLCLGLIFICSVASNAIHKCVQCALLSESHHSWWTYELDIFSFQIR